MSDEMLTCAKCGKKFLFKSEGLNRWAKNPNTDPKKVVCDECHSGKAPKAPVKTTTTTSSSFKKPTASSGKADQTSGKNKMSAELLKKKYDELCAVFGDNLDDVKDYLGGWTTTLALSETK